MAPEPSSEKDAVGREVCCEEKYAVALLFTLCFNKRRASGSSHLQGLALIKAFKLERVHMCFLDIVYGA